MLQRSLGYLQWSLKILNDFAQMLQGPAMILKDLMIITVIYPCAVFIALGASGAEY